MNFFLKQFLIIVFFLTFTIVWADNIYVNLVGAGNKDGSNWDNAIAFNEVENWQKVWDSMSAGDTLYIEGGDYPAQQLIINSNGRNKEEILRICGVPRGGKYPTFIGSWNKTDKEKGFSVFKIKKNSTWWVIENINIEKCKVGIEVEGNSSFGQLENINMREMREGIIITGGAEVMRPEIGSHDIVIRNCRIENYVKRGFRFKDGCYNIVLENCFANSGGKEWATEPFQMGFSLQGGKEGVYDHDITFINCDARNNYWDAGEGYWNADGFCAERNSYNITFIGCSAFDNTDGGWDLKTINPLLIGCISLRNKKNFRFWSNDPGTVMIRCLGAYAFKRGGNSEECGLWTTGKVFAYKCSFVHNTYSIFFNDWHVTPEKEKEMKIQIEDCIVTLSDKQKDIITRVDNINSIIWLSGSRKGENIGYSNPEKCREFFDIGDAFDSIEFGSKKGYYSGWKKENLLDFARSKQPLININPQKLPATPIPVFKGEKNSGWYLSGWKDANMKLYKENNEVFLAIVSNGAGGASYQTKREDAVVDLISRIKVKWVLQIEMKVDNFQGRKDLKIRALTLDNTIETNEIPLSLKDTSEWQFLQIPLVDFLVDKNNEFSSFSGFYIRTFEKLKTPILIRNVFLKPQF